jgi:hypothetical protein
MIKSNSSKKLTSPVEKKSNVESTARQPKAMQKAITEKSGKNPESSGELAISNQQTPK